MKNVPLSKVFNGEYLRVITNYSNTIKKVLETYDVVIFMARKAICFYHSMIINGVLTPSDCEVVSSRVLDYNNISKLKNRKIAIIDDVVVKGHSLEKVLSEFDKHNISCHVYVAACEEKIAQKLLNNTSHCVSQKFVYLDSAEIYLFSGLITEYIELSMCPFNIDQPIYESKISIEEIVEKINSLNPFIITSGIQKKYNITSKVLYLKYDSFGCEDIDSIIQKSILKIRFLYNDDKFIAVPFVLFPEMTTTELDILYSYIKTEQTDELVYSNSDKICNENKLKIVSCFFSELLLKDLSLDGFFEKCNWIDYYQFYCETNSIYGESFISKAAFNRKLSVIECNYSQFIFPEQVGKATESIFVRKPNARQYVNSSGKKIEDIVVTYHYLYDMFQENRTTDFQIVSSTIDILIDRGMIVPSIVHFDNKIVRAYKLGEYSKLTRTQIRSFAAMLYKYQELINSNLGKIEFEKLCVLFFSQGIFQKYFDQQTEYEEDCYSVCYSLYGPRMSDGDKAYKVDSDSALITDFLEDEVVKKENNTYVISPVYIDDKRDNVDLKNFSQTFALQYSKLRKLFDAVKEKEEENRKQGITQTLWNQYVHTYSQYLTLRSIGNSKKNQFLSLCAELYQILLIDDSYLEFYSDNKKKFSKIVSGINSGLWKYFCYKNDALNKTNRDIFDKDQNVAAIIASSNIPVREDRNPALEKVIDQAGELLFYTAFFIQNVVSNMNKINYFNYSNNFDSDLGEETSKSSKTVFSHYYYKMFEDKRRDVESKIKQICATETITADLTKILNEIKSRCQIILDYCELYLSSETSNYDSFKKIIILYSEKEDLPDTIGNIKEVFLDSISSKSKCKVFILPDRETGNAVLCEILEKTYDIDSIHYMVFNMNVLEHGAIQICDRAKGTFLSNVIKKEINRIKDEPLSPSHKMTFISDRPVKDFSRNNYSFVQTKHELISDGYTRTTLDIIK